MGATKTLLTAEQFDNYPFEEDKRYELEGITMFRRMIRRKLKQYFEAGVKEVWLIDPDSREIEVWRGAALPDHPLTVGEALTSPLLPGFELPLADLFA